MIYVRVMDGRIKPGMKIKMMRGRTEHVVIEVGQFRPGMETGTELTAGQAGYVMAQIKNINDAHVGDTLTDALNPTAEPLAGYKEPKPMVYSGLYPTNNNEFEDLREALAKLKLNDSSFTYEPESSEGLGFGFRCGFLGMLHREIIGQRLERDCEIDLVHTAPNVTYEILRRNGEVITVKTPQDVPDSGDIVEFREPVSKITFLLPAGNVGDVMKLCADRRGVFRKQEYLSPTRVLLEYEIPLAEVIFDLYDKLKSVTNGYGTMDYEAMASRPDDLVRLDVLVHHKRVDALSVIVHRSSAEKRGRRLISKFARRSAGTCSRSPCRPRSGRG